MFGIKCFYYLFIELTIVFLSASGGFLDFIALHGRNRFNCLIIQACFGMPCVLMDVLVPFFLQ